MFQLLMLSDEPDALSSVLPALDLLGHRVEHSPTRTASGDLARWQHDAVLLDGRKDLITARNVAQLLVAKEVPAPVLMVLTEGGMAAVAATWQVDDVVLDSAGPAEVEARLRLLTSRAAEVEEPAEGAPELIRAGSVTIDDAAYSARVSGTPLNLTYKEFELLKFLAQHPGRVFTRAQLLSEVWGYDYYGGTRTVDVHIRRLRSKLGPDHDHLITTVRNVGYSLTADRPRDR